MRQCSLNKNELAAVAARCEQHIGTQGGGMDQAIAFLAQPGQAQFIEWNPLRATAVSLPTNAVFVIANSLAEANKAATSDFNERVVECRLACSLMAKHSGLAAWRTTLRFAELQNVLHLKLVDMAELAEKCFPKTVYKRSELAAELEINDDELAASYLSANTKHLQGFRLRQRALHVIQGKHQNVK